MPKNIELGVRLTADGKGFVGAITVSDKAVRKGLSPRVRWNCQMTLCAGAPSWDAR